MDFAVIGLAFTHPYTYTRILQRIGHQVTYVWDHMPDRLSQFAEEYGATPLASPDAAPDGIDGVMATGRFPERVDHAIAYLRRGVPVYSSKPMATSTEQLNRLVGTVQETGTPFLSTSVLRFAPAMLTLKRHLQGDGLGTLVSVRAVSAHDVGFYMSEPNIWQDDPVRGGGTIITMGVHALEMLVTLLGPNIRRVWCQANRRVYTQSLSEDAAILTLEWDDGLLGVADIPSGVRNVEYFGVELFGSETSLRCSIPKGDIQGLRGDAIGDVDSLAEAGYVGTIEAFVEMCRTGTSSVPIEESAAIARTLLAARKSAATGQPVLLNTTTTDNGGKQA